VSRLSELVARVAKVDPSLADDLQREVDVLSNRRPFGLNFERHVPESVELPNRNIRIGDKVVFRADQDPDRQSWIVVGIYGKREARAAELLGHQSSGEQKAVIAPISDLVVIAEFRDPIYPGLRSTGTVERGGDRPFHTVINGENFHVIQALTFSYRGQVDCIYIDPPYNSGARDWKYNNDYVDAEDAYRHSKWLAMMERRLLAAKELLNPADSVLIVTVDEKEYLRLGLLLQQTFPDAQMQMVSIAINAKGTGRVNEFRRVDEFAYFLRFGGATIKRVDSSARNPYTLEFGNGRSSEATGLDWQTFRRRDLASRRGTSKGGPRQFYPIYVNKKTGRIEEVGDPLPHGVERAKAPKRRGCVAVFPVRPDGTEMNWSLTKETFLARMKQGFVRVGQYKPNDPQQFVLLYLKTGVIEDIELGRAIVTGRNPDGSVIARYEEERAKMPTTQWRDPSHSAEHYGTGLLKALLPGRSFPYPKSLYAVEDCLRLFLSSKVDALVLDFFAGSGTTAHAVMRLNRQDGGRRQSVMVTNNEVSAEEADKLSASGLVPGEPEWERLGICEHITKPRLRAALTGETPLGEPIKGRYKFIDESPIADGFEENMEFFDLTYEDPEKVRYGLGFKALAPLLWLRAGACGGRVEDADQAFALTDAYAILFDLDQAAAFVADVRERPSLRIAYIVSDDEAQFQIVTAQLPPRLEAVRLYAAYLDSFGAQAGV
jgi:adenine-specific DNA-methyltransferase